MRRQVNFTEATAMLANPYMGLQSCDGPAQSASWPSQIAYCKYYRHELQPSRNLFNFSWFDEQLDASVRRGQLFGFRIMEADESNSSPIWLKNLGCAGFNYLDSADGGTDRQWVADVSDPIFIRENAIFLRALYDHIKARKKLKNIAFIDIGTVGLWGEWHFSGLNPAVPMPSAAAAKTIIDQVQTIFPDIQSFAQIVDPASAAYAMSHGAGWRGDGLGDPAHDTRHYPRWIAAANAADAWKRAPVSFESYLDVAGWVAKKWDIKGIVDFALGQHLTYVNLKGWNKIPDVARAEITRLVTKIGYRPFVSQVVFEDSLGQGGTFSAQVTIKNTGVAPTYYPIDINIKAASTVIGGGQVKLLPGESKVVNFAVPNAWGLVLPPANYSLAISLSMNGFPVQPASSATYVGKDLKFGTLKVI